MREYNHLLTSQLEEQRNYFEHQLAQKEQEVRQQPELKELNYTI